MAAIESQGPDLNRSIVDLQSTAWPLRHLGPAYEGYEQGTMISVNRISSGFDTREDFDN